jgi:hypothetical protein
VDAVHIDIIAAPGKCLAVGVNDDPREIVDGPSGTVVARNPLRVLESERTGAYRYFQTSMEKMPRRIGEVYMQGDWGLGWGRYLCLANSGGKEEQINAGENRATLVHYLIISQQ